MFAALKLSKVNELFMDVQDAHLQKYSGKALAGPDRDVLRAELVRSKLKGKNTEDRR
jgi:protein-arginine kinase